MRVRYPDESPTQSCLVAFSLLVGVACLVVCAACTTAVDAKRRAAYLDEVAGVGSLALLNPNLTPEGRQAVRQRIDAVLEDAGAHYK